MKLASYANGEWYRASSSGKVLSNAVTGEAIAEISSDGLDFAMLADYARRVGGPALRKHSVSPARADVEGPCEVPDGAQGNLLRVVERDRRDPFRFVDRHRGRHRHAVYLFRQGPA